MAAFFDNLRAIVDDFKTSWYFRIWASLWCVCALLSFIALIVLGARSDTAAKEENFNLWVENKTELSFPRFHFRLTEHSEAGEEFTGTPQCTHNGALLTTSKCAPWRGHDAGPQSKCFAVNAETVTVPQQWHEPLELLRIHCTFDTKGFSDDKNSLVAFEIEGEVANFGANSGASLWIAPNANSQVYLTKSILSLDGRKPEDAWERELVYHSTVHTPGKYRVTAILRSFHVHHIEQRDAFPGWVAVGDIGGFAYFMLILHTIIMMGVGVFFNNDSKFLSGGSSETRSML